MGTHKLSELGIEGQASVLHVLPNFDFYRLQQVQRLCLVADDSEAKAFDLELEITYDEGDQTCLVEMAFVDVRMVKLPELTPSFSFGELEFEDVSHDQLEGIRYRAKDYGMTGFEVFCRSVRISVHVPTCSLPTATPP